MSAWARATRILASPQLRPVEIWAVRLAVGWLAVKLGIDATALAH